MRTCLLFLVSLLFLAKSYSQTMLTGQVLDKTNNEPLIGANVSLKGTAQGVMSDLDGNFRIESKTPNGILICSFIGYQDIELPFEGNQHFSIKLKANDINLQDVVVIGYGKVKKQDLSTAVSSVEGLQQMKSRPALAANLLQGSVAGVNVMNTGGDPGAKPQIIIRGLGSPKDQPLWVIDGVPGAPVNTEDIETITVLKDAASAAIYGANVGSGGVIIVTTKQAKSGKARLSVKFATGLQQAAKLPEALNAEEFNRVKNLAASAAGTSLIEAFDKTKNPAGAVNRTDWIDEIFRTGKVNRIGLSVSGGTERLKAFASFEANQNEGILLNTFNNSLGGKLNLDFRLSDKIRVSQWLQVGTSRGYTNDTQSGYTGAIISAIYMPPSASVYDVDGNFGGVTSQELSAKYAGAYGDIVNPVAMLLRKDVYNPSYTLHSTTKLDVDIFKSLKFHSAFTASGNQQLYQDFQPKRPEPGKPNDQNSRGMSSSFSQRWLWENTLTFDKQVNAHRLTAIAGHSASYTKNKGFGLRVFNFNSEDTYGRHLVNGDDWSKNKPTEDMAEEAYKSMFSRLTYVYAGKYFLTGSVRHDATSKLYKDNNSGIFPAASLAWKISGEDFFQVPAINLLKLRASWGQIGNVSSVPNYSFAANYAASRSSLIGLNAQRLSGLGRKTITNPALTWETSEQTDFGIDMELFGGKLNVVADYYIKKTKDLIDALIVPATAGIIDEPLGNIGLVRNEGFELAINYGDHKNDFAYRVGVNLSYTKNTVEDLGDRTLYPNSVSVRGVLTPVYSSVGEAWNSFYLIKTDGIFQTDDEAANYKNTDGIVIQPNAKAGDLKFVDKNGDGIINDNDREFMGSAMPKLNFGLNAYFAYKGFDLSLLIQGIGQAKVFNAFKSTTLTASEQGYNMAKDILDAWSPDNTGSNIPKISATDPNKNFQTNSDWFLEDASYLRLKNITLGYSLPKQFLQRIKMSKSNFRVYVSAENVFTLTNYSGMDPEVGNYGVDVGKYPVSRMISFGANIDF